MQKGEVHTTMFWVCWLLFHCCDQISDKQLKESCLFWLVVAQHSAYSCLVPWTWAEHHGCKGLKFREKEAERGQGQDTPKDLPQ